MLRATAYLRAAAAAAAPCRREPFDHAVLESDERHMRRRVIQLAGGERLFVDLAEPVALDHRDILVLDDGRHAEIIAAEETLYEVRGDDARHLTELAWHIGNRHLPAAIEPGRLLIRRDPVIRTMLEGLGAVIAETREIFQPARGAYGGSHPAHGRSGDHGHHHHS
jgi:urease accessory protein